MAQAIPSATLAGEFGPVLLVRKVAQPDAVATLGVGVVCLIAGMIMMAVGARGFDGGPSFTLGLGAFLGLIGSVIFIVTFRTYWSKRGDTQFVHERGLREETARRTTCIGYDDADELEYRVADHYHNGVYVATFDHFALRTTGSPGKEIIYRGPRRKREDPTPFPPIVDAISARLAARIVEAVGRGESARWTSKMTIHPDGLALAPRHWGQRPGLALSKELPARVGWHEIDHIDFNQGICQVWLKGSTSARLIVEGGEPNFHPGYRAVMRSSTRGPRAGRRCRYAGWRMARRSRSNTPTRSRSASGSNARLSW